MKRSQVPEYTLFDPWVALKLRFREQVHVWWHGRNLWEKDDDLLDIPPPGE